MSTKIIAILAVLVGIAACTVRVHYQSVGWGGYFSVELVNPWNPGR